MALLQNLDDFDTNGQKGDWCFAKDDEYLFLQWGDTHDDICTVRIAPGGAGQNHWGWNGNREAPTLSPSIRVMGHQASGEPLKSVPDRWHGFLRDGKLVTA